jgi:hypothetical protein
MGTILNVIPDTHVQGSLETIPVKIDMVDLLDLEAGQAIGAPAAQLIDVASGVNYAGGLNGAISVSGTVVTQSLKSLVAGHRYRLIVTFTAVAGTVYEVVLEVEVPI